MQKNCQNTIFGSSRISFHFLNSIFQGGRFSFQFLNSIFQGSRISFRFLNFCQECYYFQKLVGVVVFTKVRGPFGSLDLLKVIYHPSCPQVPTTLFEGRCTWVYLSYVLRFIIMKKTKMPQFQLKNIFLFV